MIKLCRGCGRLAKEPLRKCETCGDIFDGSESGDSKPVITVHYSAVVLIVSWW